ncbi:MAG: flavin reductase [Coprococcus sp.]
MQSRILDETCTFETIKHFGYQSGRDVDKMKTLELPVNEQGIPYLGWQSVAMLGATVTEKISCGSHTLFIGTVTKSKILSEKEPLTYAEYQRRVKMYT